MVVANSKNMYKFNTVLFFCIFGLICLAETQEPETLDEKSVDPDYAAKKLKHIQSNEALPMVLYKTRRSSELVRPNELIKVTLLDGKMIHGIQFDRDAMYEKFLFCPHENKENKCLVPKTFKETERLECASEAKPEIQSMRIMCRNDLKSTFYMVVYPICKSDTFAFGTEVINFYRICYNADLQKTLFTMHTFISPKLLDAKLLLREREVNYTIMEKHEFDIFRSSGPDDMEIDNKSTPAYSATKPDYKWQELVPPEDMAFGLWRRTTFQKTNIALQHEQLISLWDKIGEYIRSQAIKMYTEHVMKTVVYTGVFDVDSGNQDNGGSQLSNIWVKVVFATKGISDDLFFVPTQGVAILMNNFVYTETNLNSKAIEQFCDQDLCVDSLSDEFKLIKGHVRCCLITQKIVDLFKEFYIGIEELRILNVNGSEDEETLTEHSLKTHEEAAIAFREIQSKEMLPVILLSNPINFKLEIPMEIKKIETKNRRIVNGSEFICDSSTDQLFFCSNESSDDECLEPRSFGRLEPLECTKEAKPVVQQLLGSSNKCGINQRGTLYKVIYKICPAKEPYDYRTTEIEFYQFCYDEDMKKIVHAHYKIMSEKLLISQLLFREREVDFDMMKDDILTLSNYEELSELAKKESENFTSSEYKLQTLVPSEDMAFASWKKSTYRYVNVALQHERLILLWKDVNLYVQYNAFKSDNVVIGMRSSYKHSNNSIYTGVVYNQSSSIGDQKPEIWFKIVYTNRSIPYDKYAYNAKIERPPQEGIVILMNNFLIPEAEDSTTSNSEDDTLKNYCTENECADEFQKKVEKIGGRVRCCRWTAEIAQKLGIPHDNGDYEVLSIKNITYF